MILIRHKYDAAMRYLLFSNMVNQTNYNLN
jgi:hypothetical protein